MLPDSRGFAPNGPANWSAGFLPAAYQGTMVRPSAKNPIEDLFPPDEARAGAAGEADGLALLRSINTKYREGRRDDTRLDARIAGYELAARLQLSAPEVLDISKETAATRSATLRHRRQGHRRPRPELPHRAPACSSRGTRFVQIWSGADNGFPRRNWDSHEDIARDHGDMGRSLDRPAAALIKDLKARGLLEDTIVLWTTEFGRMPCAQGGKGRDHNPFTFTNWLAGGGIKGGVTSGASDEWSFRAAEKTTYCYDVHATILHLLGIDDKKLVFRHNGIDRRLTGCACRHVIRETWREGVRPFTHALRGEEGDLRNPGSSLQLDLRPDRNWWAQTGDDPTHSARCCALSVQPQAIDAGTRRRWSEITAGDRSHQAWNRFPAVKCGVASLPFRFRVERRNDLFQASSVVRPLCW